jgi:hypothetical protein
MDIFDENEFIYYCNRGEISTIDINAIDNKLYYEGLRRVLCSSKATVGVVKHFIDNIRDPIKTFDILTDFIVDINLLNMLTEYKEVQEHVSKNLTKYTDIICEFDEAQLLELILPYIPDNFMDDFIMSLCLEYHAYDCAKVLMNHSKITYNHIIKIYGHLSFTPKKLFKSYVIIKVFQRLNEIVCLERIKKFLLKKVILHPNSIYIKRIAESFK